MLLSPDVNMNIFYSAISNAFLKDFTVSQSWYLVKILLWLERDLADESPGVCALALDKGPTASLTKTALIGRDW